MSNNVTIQRRKVKNLDTGQTWLEAHIFDDYGSLDSVIMEPMIKNNFGLFLHLLELQLTNGTENIENILQYMDGAKSGITIGGEYLDYDIIEYALSNYIKETADE